MSELQLVTMSSSVPGYMTLWCLSCFESSSYEQVLI